MNYLEKAWVRALISFLLGGIAPEAIFIATGDPNQPKSESCNIMILMLVVAFILD